jgi:hypothetical protein
VGQSFGGQASPALTRFDDSGSVAFGVVGGDDLLLGLDAQLCSKNSIKSASTVSICIDPFGDTTQVADPRKNVNGMRVGRQ